MDTFTVRSTLDPATSGGTFDLVAGGMIFDNLLKTDGQFTLHPALAESWEVARDASEWIFRIRKDVEFHDGSSLTAGDVVYTLKRILNPATGSPSQQALASSLDFSGVERLDKYTVRLRLKTPNAFLGQLLANYNLRVVKEGATGNDLNTHAIGTGPFKCIEYSSGNQFFCIQNPNYWQSGLPLLDGARIISIADPAAKLQAVLSGDADIVDEIQPSQIPQVLRHSSVRLLVGRNFGFQVLAFRQTISPFDDVRVLQALKMAIDRDRMVNVILQGYGSRGADVPVAPDDVLYPSGFNPLPCDPGGAKRLLLAAGYRDGLNFVLYTTENLFMRPAAIVFADQARRANIHVTLKHVPAQRWGRFTTRSLLSLLGGFAVHLTS
ncbi:MAG TPA: ABC transporter substrate-binding protein [Acidobacteriota bacterium]